MTTKEVETKDEMVEIVCSGISARQGFNVYPHGEPSSYIEFEPERNKDGGIVSGKSNPVSIRRETANYLIAQDPSRFQIVSVPEAPKAPEVPAPAKAKGKGKK